MDFKIVDVTMKYISGETYDTDTQSDLITGAYGGKSYTAIKVDKIFLWINFYDGNFNLPSPICDYLVTSEKFKWYGGNFYDNYFEAYWYGGYFEGGTWNGTNKVTNTFDQPPKSGSNNSPKIKNYKQI
jgi:hypothetical protein